MARFLRQREAEVEMWWTAGSVVARPLMGAGMMGGLLGGWLAGRAVVRWLRRESVRGKTVIVTGGTRGLGLDLVRALADEGAQIAFCARDPDEVERTEAELRARGASVLAQQCDVTDPEQVRAFVDAVLDRMGGIDILITNAATIQVGPLDAMAQHDFEDAFSSIFWGTYHPTMAVLPHMRQRGAGHLVHITSAGGRIGIPHLVPYCTAKFAATGFSEGLRAELRKHGIRVTTITPALLRTGAHENVPFKGQHEQEYSWFATAVSLPWTSLASDVAARRIVSAIEHHDRESTLSLPTRLGLIAHAVAPSLTTALLRLEDRLLPTAEGGSSEPVRGFDIATQSESVVVKTIEAIGASEAEAHHAYPGPVHVPTHGRN